MGAAEEDCAGLYPARQPAAECLQSDLTALVRYDWLGHYLFESLNELQEFATNWLWVYNHERPNMALGGYTPKQRLAQAARFLYFCECP